MKIQWISKFFSALLIVLLMLGTFPVPAARAATFTVSKTNDTNDGTCNADCSLREAIVAANAAAGADIIILASGSTYTLSIAGADNTSAAGDLDVAAGGLTINTSGAGTATIDANDIDRIFHVLAGASLNLNNITVTDGTNTVGGGMIVEGTATINGGAFTSNTANGAGTNNGGAISVTGTLTVGNTTGVSFTNNIANDNGGAIYHDAATTLSIANSTFTTNSATGGDGGAINTNNAGSTLTITNSTFTGNTAGDDGGAIRNVSEPTTITRSTFANNSINSTIGDPAMGGAIWNEGVADATSIRLTTFTGNSVTHTTTNDDDAMGGAIVNDGSPFILANVTFSGNSASYTGGSNNDALGGALYANATSTIHNVTFSGNTVSETGSGAASGGNIYRNNGTVTLANTIVTNGTPNNCGGTITNGGNNIDSAASCGWAANLGSMSNTNPNLGALTGTPAYFPLNAGSPARNVGSNTICSTATTTNNESQNGLTRPQSVTCDIGSYEALGLIVTTTTITADTADPSVTGETVSVTVTVSGGATPTGTVDITGADVNCSITLVGGTGSCNVTFNTVGSKTLTASYLGDATHDPSSDTESHVVNQAATTTSISSDPTDPSIVGQAYAVSASVTVTAPGGGTPTGTITVSDGSQTCTITLPATSCNLTSTTAGAKSLTATYNGNANYAASTSANEPHQVNQATTTTTITADTPDPSLVGQAYSVTASVTVTAPGGGTPTGTITVSDGTDTCTITLPAASCNLTSTTSGAKTLTATYNGTVNYAGSTSVSVPHQVNEAPEMDVRGNAISITDGDTTPIAADNTDFGPVPQNIAVDRTFTIHNTGVGSLTIDDINFIGGDNGDFSLVPAITFPVTVGSGNSTSFTVRLTAGGGGGPGGGIRNTTVSIDNNDPNEAPYTFDIQGTRFNAEINVQGGFPLTNITDGQGVFSLAAANCTYFPSASYPGGFSDCTYTISNQDPANALYVGTVTTGGADAADFVVIAQPALSVIPVGGNTTFTVRFTPSRITGLIPELATISFNNNDAGESPYNWTVGGLSTPNTPPTTSGIPNVNVLEDAANTNVDLFPSFADTESIDSELTYTVTGNTNPGLFTSVTAPPLGGQFLVLDYAPDTFGTANITILATDAGGLTVNTTFTVTVASVNDAPSFIKGADQTVNEDAAAQTVAGWATSISAGAANESGQTLTFNASNDNNGLFSVQPAIAADGTLTYTPAPDANGVATVTVTLSDDGGTANGGVDTSASQTFTITVNAVNDTPSFVAGADQTVNEDAGAQTVAGWATGISAGPANESGQTLTFTVIGNTNPGLFSAGPDVDEITGDLTFTPTANANGSANITLILSDDGGGTDTSAPQSFTITVDAVNDTPSFVAGADQTVDEDAGPQTVLGWATGISAGPANESGQVLTFNITGNDNPALFSVLPVVNETTGSLTYTPAADEHGTATITLTLSDDGGGADTSAPQTFTITVNSVNDVPSFIAGPDQNLSEDAPAQTVANWATGISAGPANESGQTLTFNVSNDNNGLFTVQPAVASDGTLTYTPAANTNGVANVTLTLSDDGGTANGGVDTSAPQIFTITIGSVNDAPSFTVGADEVVDEDAGAQTVAGWATGISAGPADEAGQILTFNASNDNNGLFAVQPALSSAGTLTYTPAADANGVATVTLTLSDNGGTANGGVDTSAPQTFTITVNSVNDVPSYVKGADQNVNEDAGAQSVPGWATGMSTGPANEAGQVLTFVITGNTNPGLFSAGPAVDPITGDLTYTPTANTNGSATISLVISDDGGTANGGVDTSASQTFVINVGAVNDPPSFVVGPDQTVNEDAGAQVVPGWATGISAGPADEAGQTVTFNITGNTNPGLFSVLPVVNEATGNLTYTPVANAFGSATITLTLSDDGGGTDTSAPQNFIITVSPINDVPSFVKGPDQSLFEDAGPQSVAGWATALSAGPANEAAQVLTFNITGNTNPGLFSAGPAVNGTTGDLTFTTAPNANGFATVTLTISDNGGGTDTSAPQSFVISVTAVNDAPSFTAGPDQTVNENAGPQTAAGWATGMSAGPADEAAQVLTFNVIGNTNPGLFSAGPAVNPITGNLTYTPALNANGSADITLTLSDNGGTANGGSNTSASQTFTINVISINNAPFFTIGPDQTVDEDAGPQTVAGWATGISAGAPNEIGQILTFNVTGNTNPALFSAGPAVAANGTLTFTPTANANGSADITLTLSDNGGTANGGADTSGPQTFTITVNPVNDAPSFTAGPDQTINEDAGPITVPNWATGISVGPANETGQILTFNVTNDNNALFSVQPAIAANGTLTYTAAANTNGSALVTVTLSDNGGTANSGFDTSAAQTFTITVDPNDDPPVAVDDTATVWQDSPANTIDVLFNDTDIDGGAKLVTITTLASNGTVTNNTTDVSYQPDTGYCGPDSFTYTLNGGSTATVDITVTCKTTVTAVITASDKVYNGTNVAAFTCTLMGVISPDDVSCSGGSATFPDKDAAIGKTVTATGLGLSGVDAFKYQLASTSATDTADITPRPLLVTATGIDKIFDGNTTATVNLSDDRLAGDDLTVTYASASFADPNVGVNKPVSVTGISISGGVDAGNYTPNTTANTTASIGIQTQTITVIVPAPPAATNGSSFDVEAIASSGLPVTITTSGACSGGDTDGTATITMTSGTGTCTIFYNQAGDGNYIAAPQVTEVVNATLGPVFTSADNTTFDLGFPGSFNITATGNPSTMTITVTGTLPGGITLTDNGDGTATFSGTPTNAGVFNLILTANNGVLPNAVQNFTMTVKNGPTAKGINTVPDTGDASLIENESIASELNLTHIIVEFSQDVYNPSGDSDADDVTNPANYVLVRSATGAFQTVSCAGGALAPDVAIKVNSVAYSNGGGSAPGPYIATLSVNDGLPLNVDGYYRLYVCGTTSIVDAVNTALALAGNGVTPGTDFHRNFRITAPGTGGGGDDDDDDGDGGGGSGTTGNISTNTASLNGVLIPVTGFAPNRVTRLPEQPAEYAYTDSGLVIEIPSLGVKVSIVGVQFKDRKWDVTWLANNVGFLEGSAYPTWKGNTVITGHVTDTNGKPGPFAYINELQVGNKVYIHNDGFIYVYEVRQTRLLLPASTRTLFRHEDDSWLSLITCENLNAKGDKFTQRRLVRAVLISIIPEK